MYDMRDWLVSGKPCKAEEYELLASCWQVAGKPPRLILSLWNLPVFFAKGIRCLAIFEQWPYDVHSAIDWFFPCQFFLISPNAVLRNPGEIVDSTVKGSHEASSNWLRPSCSFWTWAFLPFQSPCRLSMCPVFYVAQWIFSTGERSRILFSKECGFTPWHSLEAPPNLRPCHGMGLKRAVFGHGLLVPPWIIH